MGAVSMSCPLRKTHLAGTGIPLTKPSFSALSLPNVLTFFRLGCAFVILGLCFVHQPWSLWTRNILFAVAALTDFFDGYFARLYNQISRLGRLLDPLADKLLVVPMLLIFVDQGKIDGFYLIPALVIVARELAAPTLKERYMEMTHTALHVPLLAKWKTAVEMMAVAILMATDLVHVPMRHSLHTLGLWVMCVAAFLGVASFYSYCRCIRRKL